MCDVELQYYIQLFAWREKIEIWCNTTQNPADQIELRTIRSWSNILMCTLDWHFSAQSLQVATCINTWNLNTALASSNLSQNLLCYRYHTLHVHMFCADVNIKGKSICISNLWKHEIALLASHTNVCLVLLCKNRFVWIWFN